MRLIQQIFLTVAIVLYFFESTTAAVAEQKPAPVSAASPELDAAQAVITIRGLCREGAQKDALKGTACSMTITRQEFEKLLDALNPGEEKVSPTGRQNLARAYVEVLAFEEAAKKAGIEDTVQFQQVLNWARLRTIAELYRRDLQKRYGSPTQQEIAAYYQEHRASFERVRLLRILVPRQDSGAQSVAAQGVTDQNVTGQKQDDFDKKALAAARAAHARAMQGEDFGKIQKDAYAALGLSSPPATDLGSFGRADFMEKEAAEVFSLQQGEVSQIETELKSYVIYKVTSRETLPESQVKAEIAREISQQKYKDAIKAVMDSALAEFNEQYFGPMPPRPPLDAPVVPRPTGH